MLYILINIIVKMITCRKVQHMLYKVSQRWAIAWSGEGSRTFHSLNIEACSTPNSLRTHRAPS